ncbi:hypothetical protein M011DRAFT_397486 [Sporormia fimetaria CBS 119925]|uniref:Zinc finger C2H2 LYAR-type domain-containing protein n=1 Tax=Sporormia fimetaria CBS 119925 TaxID=1340428 RepID=A0A6A6VG83_9PLEO|nr:hypothetical protein M011DRAFT_397486 [Sporormia fimetaria CBS 119925]
MVSFSCEGCGDVLTKKKLDPHRNRCYGATFTCIDCMVHFQGTSYRSHTSCMTEDQKYQGKLYREKKPKGRQQKNNAAPQNNENNSQALVPHNAYVEDATDGDSNAIAVVDAPPRAPSPPPAARSLGYEERAALPPVNVFDFLDPSEAPQAVNETRMIEDSIPPAYEEHAAPDVMNFQVPDDKNYKQNGFTYGNGPVHPTTERHDSSYNLAEQNFTTPAPKTKQSKSKSRDKDLDTTTKKTDRKRKRNSPAELDMSLVRAQQDRDVIMSDAPPMLHSGLTGGLNRLLARPEFPPSPELSEAHADSPLSPMKRAKQGASKALLRAQREWDTQQEKERKAEEKKERKEKERGRERERKERKVNGAWIKTKPKKRRDDSARARRHTRRRDVSSSASPTREMKAIEYNPENSNSALIVRPNGELAQIRAPETRAELFLSFVNKGPESERGMSINKALKRYHRERHHERWDKDLPKADEEKELFKNLRLKKNDRGEIVLFFAEGEA